MASRDPDDHDGYDRDDERGFSFRQRLSGLLDPEGAFGKVTDLASGTKTEVVRIVSREVRGFLDQMDTVDLMQQVIAGLVIDVSAQIRFSFEEKDDGSGETQLTPTITKRETTVQSQSRNGADKKNGKDKKNGRNGNGNGKKNGNGDKNGNDGGHGPEAAT